MIFTIIPIPKQQIASDSFRSREIADEAPCPVFESRVSIMSATLSMRTILFFQYLWAFTAARLLDTTVAITSYINVLSAPTNETFLPSPSLIVTFREYNDTIRALLTEIGYSYNHLVAV
jgi:hypothetical protein